MSTSVRYKGSVLTELDNETKTLNTAGKWLEDDIEITDTSSGGSGGLVYQDEDGYIVLGDGSEVAGEYTARIVGNGSFSNAYVDHNGNRYYTNGQVFQFSGGDTIRFVAEYVTSTLTLNGVTIASSSPTGGGTGIHQTLSDISYDIVITLRTSSPYGIDIDARAKLNIEEDGTYYTDGYDLAIVDTKAGAIINKQVDGVYKNSNINTVGSYAFYHCELLDGASLPNVQRISSNAFEGCRTLSYVYAPNLSSVGENAFYMCYYLTSIPNEALRYIGSGAFRECSNLTEVTLTSTSLQSVGGSAFQNCRSLSKINLPNCKSGFISGSGTFRNCIALQEISAPQLVSFGCSYLFESCSALQEINFPQATTLTGIGLFSGCGGLVSASFPVVTTFPAAMFYNCRSLTNVYAPSLTLIASSAFLGCSALREVNFPLVSRVSTYAFRYCEGLMTASFDSLTYMESYAFAGCTNLSRFYAPSVSVISTYCFASCSNLVEINIKGLSGTIPNNAFISAGIRSIYLPYVSSTGGSVFAGCSSLNTVIIGNSTTATSGSIVANTFYRCTTLLSLYVLTPYIPYLISTAFTSTPISTYTTETGGVRGNIYVRESLYDSFRTSTYWSAYSSQFVSMTNAEIEALISTLD